MSESRLHYLFNAYFNKIATAKERDELMELLAESKNDDQVKIFLTEAWQKFNSQSQFFSDSQGDEMLANILQKETVEINTPVVELNKRNPSIKWPHIAAAAVFIIAIGGISIIKVLLLLTMDMRGMAQVQTR